MFSLPNFVVCLEKQIGLFLKINEELIPFSIWRLVGMYALSVPKFLLPGSVVAGFHVSCGPTSVFGWIWSSMLNMLTV